MMLKFKNFYSLLHKRLLSNKTCLVYVANTTNPFQNLAFEHWLYVNKTFDNQNILFVWRNQPSVVIGRHQNPWRECNVSLSKSDGVHICRRDSGGGAVYHDLGNINFTFFTEQKDYNRKRNLETITSGLIKTWPFLNLHINKRDDIVLNKTFKISGTAAKLTRKSSYHHCTLLINANKKNIQKYLYNNSSNISCNATSSVRSNILNLCDVDKSIDFQNVCNSVVSSYVCQYSSYKIDYVNANDENLAPGVNKFVKSYQDWNWVFGKTPDFKIFQQFNNNSFSLKHINMLIKKGLITDVDIFVEVSSHIHVIKAVESGLIGVQFSKKAIANKLTDILSKFCNENSDFSIPFYEYLFNEILLLLV